MTPEEVAEYLEILYLCVGPAYALCFALSRAVYDGLMDNEFADRLYAWDAYYIQQRREQRIRDRFV